MRINRIELCNFRQHADSRIAFGPGLTGIIGPNGSGKTTILEAIAWAIYGNAAARGTRDSIRFNRAPPRAAVRVELDFDLGGHNYRIVRGLTNAELHLDGSASKIADSITGVSEFLTRRLGMTRDEFFNTYFTGQKELSVMAAMSPSERAQFLSRVLGYERLRAAQDLARERRRTIGAEITGLRQGMPDAESVARLLQESESRLSEARERARFGERRREGARAELDTVRPKWEASQRERETMLTIVAELQVAESERSAYQRDLERLERELKEIASARAEQERLARDLEPFGQIAAEFQRMEGLAREEGRRRALLDTQRSVGDELAKLRERRARVESAPALEVEVSNALDTKRLELEEADGVLEARRTEWVRDRQEAETKREALRERYAELKEQHDRVVHLGAEGACPTCARPLGENYRTVLDLLDEQLETMRVDGNYFKARLEQLVEMPEDVRALDDKRRALSQELSTTQRRLTKIQLAVHELAQVASEITTKEERLAALDREIATIPPGYEQARHDELHRELERLTPLDAKSARLSAQIEREPQLVRERQRVVEALAVLHARLEDLRSRRAAITFSEQAFSELRDAFQRATAEDRAAELAVATIESEASNASVTLEMARNSARELADRQRLLAGLTSRKRLHDELDRAYSDLRTDLNFQLRPELSELASSFLGELTDNRYTELELDDQYNVIVLEDGVPKPVISGGEEDLANLVLRLAISQMIAERAGQPFSLLILDEIFGSLDEPRRGNVVDLLRRLQDRFEQVILITHIDSVRDGLDQVITVRFDDESGSSVVEQLAEPATEQALADGFVRRLDEEAGAAD